jgi:twinkle protein
MIVKPKDLLAEIMQLYHNDLQLGLSTGWPTLDEHFTVKHGEFTVLTGMPSHGKSEFLDCLLVNQAISHKTRTAIFSPENHPLEMHCAKIIEKLAQEPFFKRTLDNGLTLPRMDEDTMLDCLEFMHKHFAFVVPDNEEFTPRAVMNEALPWLDMSIVQPRVMVIDPWNEMDHYRPAGLTETEYISRILTELRRMAREFKTHLFLVAHPKILKKDADGNYPVPKPYDISGSAHWYNKADNCLAVWRDVINEPDRVEIHIQKVRFKTTGKPGMVTFRYDASKSAYFNPMDGF